MSRSLELLTEVCGPLPTTVKRMFGGYGFFAPNGGMFAGILTDDEVILKLDDERARSDLVAEGGHAWEYSGRGKTMTMASWIVVPEAFYDDLERFGVWARRAHALVPGKLAKSKARTKPEERAEPRKRSQSASRARTETRPKPEPKSKSKSKPKPKAKPKPKSKPSPQGPRRGRGARGGSQRIPM